MAEQEICLKAAGFGEMTPKKAQTFVGLWTFDDEQHEFMRMEFWRLSLTDESLTRSLHYTQNFTSVFASPCGHAPQTMFRHQTRFFFFVYNQIIASLL